jgi:hypothetical protein
MIKEYLKRRRAADALIRAKRKQRDQHKPEYVKRAVASILRAAKPRICKGCQKTLPEWSRPERKTCSEKCKKRWQRYKAKLTREKARAAGRLGRRGASRGRRRR